MVYGPTGLRCLKAKVLLRKSRLRMKPDVIVEIPNALHCCEVIIVMHWFVMLSHQHEKTELSLMQKKIKIFLWLYVVIFTIWENVGIYVY